MDCIYCRGRDTFKEEFIRYYSEDGDNSFLVDNVPAFVCILCGEKALPQVVIARLKSVKAGEATAVGEQEVPVFDFDLLDGELKG
jgi:YgiT-type zinc finger domain-containing protein